ncbi:lysine-specific demethylase 3A-like isoform X4 [Metopolophium dirhodum]|nr:lysine-specific demethylase 3A-like isoform X4 [Metopolophium dirhodum]
MSNTAQMPQMMMPYQPFHPPSVGPPPAMPPQTPAPSAMQPTMGAAGGMLWKPPAVPVANSNNNSTAANSYYHHHRPNEQQQLNSRGNAEKDVYKETKRAKQPPYTQGPAGGGKSRSGGVPIENVLNNEYGQVEIERLVNRHQRGNREHTEKQQAEAAVHQHFEESLKLAQQQRRTNWISNLPSPPKNVYPSQGPKTQDSSKQRHPSLNGANQTTNHRGVDDWKENKNKYAPTRSTPVGSSSSRPSTQQAHYRSRTVPISNFDHDNVLINANDGGNHNNMISYAPYMNTNHVYAPPSNSSVIVRNESSYKNSSMPVPEAYSYNRTPTILTVPAVKLDNKELKQAKPMHYSRTSSSSVNTSQLKGHNSSPEQHHPGPLLNTHGRYALYPPQTDHAQRDLDTPPPAHLNAMMSSALPKFVPVAVPIDDLQTEALDLVMICNKATPETDVPLYLNSNYKNAKPDPQDTTNTHDINVCVKSKKHNYLEMYLPVNDNVSSPLITLISNSTTNSAILTTTLSSTNSIILPSTVSTSNSSSKPITISTANLITVPISIPSTVSKIDPKAIPTSISSTILPNLTIIPTPVSISQFTASTEIPTITPASIPATISKPASSINVTTEISVTTSSNIPITNSTTYDSSPSTPPPVLMPATYTEMSSGIKTHHHKLKKAWLQRHVWAEDLKEAGVNIDQNPSHSFSQMDDTPPVLQCEITKKRKISKSSSDDNIEAVSPPVILPCTSYSEPSTSSGSGTKKCKKRKVSNPAIPPENKDTTDNVKPLDTEKKVPPIKIPKKRGRKPKVVVSIPLKKGKNNDGEVRFFQSGPCLNAGPKIHKCRECRIFINNKKNDLMTQDEIDNIFCRFYAFRRLFTNKTGQLMNAGFPDPFLDITEDDANLWLPNPECPPSSLDVEVAKKVLVEAGRQFCYLVKEENKALTLSPYFQGKPIAWKKAANGVREMCDVCLTTIFNYHWACAKCGFGVCIDCVKARLNGSSELPNAATMTKKDLREKDTFTWMTCNSKHNHDVERLMLTQIVASDSMDVVFSDLHKVSTLWNLAIECGCPDHPFPEIPGDASTDDDDDNVPSMSQASTSNTDDNSQSSLAENSEISSAENLKNESADNSKIKVSEDSQNIPAEGSKNSAAENSKKSPDESSSGNIAEESKSLSQNAINIEPQIAGCSNGGRASVQSHPGRREQALKHFVRKKNKYLKTIPREPLPPRVMTLAESREFFPNNPHTWLCDGKLLRLLDPEDPTNCDMFQEQWKRGQPVMVSDVGQRLNPELWSPYSFSRDFGEFTNDLIDCATGMLVEGKTMKQFWDGFEDESKRLKGPDGKHMLLKLKDWPVGTDFADTLPESVFRYRFDDLMRVLPLKDYTLRDGNLNLAARLPACFVRPDLGPKMYSAYGNAGNRDSAKQLMSTTNLHLDVSDAVNVMVYVAISHKSENQDEADHEWHVKEAYRAIDEAGCDMASRRRAREPKELPGAVWHIYHAKDADSIRDLLNKVSAERGEPLEPNHDPIHDQSSYLDADLRARLYTEYGVQGYAVVQCLGDAIFIPAGAPHQVRNLHSCIKVAGDFVSPENVSQCFRLMNEFRELSSSHSNHEDKLQIKNIMFHAVKDSISVLLHNNLEEPQEQQEPEEEQEK